MTGVPRGAMDTPEEQSDIELPGHHVTCHRGDTYHPLLSVAPGLFLWHLATWAPLRLEEYKRRMFHVFPISRHKSVNTIKLSEERCGKAMTEVL